MLSLVVVTFFLALVPIVVRSLISSAFGPWPSDLLLGAALILMWTVDCTVIFVIFHKFQLKGTLAAFLPGLFVTAFALESLFAMISLVKCC